MSNVIQLTFPARSQGRAARRAALLDRFATQRRSQEDVFWLKENAEVLNILESTGQTLASGDLTAEALAPYEEIYETLEQRLGFFPQYYRFYLSLALDLEALGLPGDKAERMVHWAHREGLAGAELSDLQRAEARRLMLRRGIDPCDGAGESQALTERLLQFMARPATFMLPNKKAAYELTHIVFYLSAYGRKSTQFSASAMESLNFAGTLAYLDLNADLLAEVCVAMRYAGATPPDAWEDWLSCETTGFTVDPVEGMMGHDGYHEFLVSNWAMATADRQDMFRQTVPDGRVAFHAAPRPAGPLRRMSQCLLNLGEERSGDWTRMQAPICEALADDAAVAHLDRATRACGDFDSFFAGFARSSRVMAPEQRALA